MKITDAQFETAAQVAENHDGPWPGCLRAAIESLPEPAPGPATLRPIAEMPTEVPEGCIRYGFDRIGCSAKGIMSGDTHFLDIRLPVPADAEREAFMDAMKTIGVTEFWCHPDRDYADPYVNGAWKGFQLARKAAQNP